MKGNSPGISLPVSGIAFGKPSATEGVGSQESEPVNTVPKLRDVEGRQSIARGHQSSTVKRQFSFKEKREFEQLEKEIPLLVAEKESVTEKLNSGSTPFGELQQLSVRIIEITRLLDEKEMRWLELSELQ